MMVVVMPRTKRKAAVLWQTTKTAAWAAIFSTQSRSCAASFLSHVTITTLPPSSSSSLSLSLLSRFGVRRSIISSATNTIQSRTASSNAIQTNLNHNHNFQSIFHHCKSYHSSTALSLNRFLFDPSEIDADPLTDPGKENENEEDPTTLTSTSTSPAVTVTLPKEDYRTIHAAKILQLQNGDTLRAGIVLDNDHHHTSQHPHPLAGHVTDQATIQWLPEGKVKKAEPLKNGNPPGSLQITLHSLQPIHQTTSSSSTSTSSKVALLLALPRPPVLARLLPVLSQLGVSHIVLFAAKKVPRDYFGSHLFRKPLQIKSLLVEGSCQAGDVVLPHVYVIKQWSEFWGDGRTSSETDGGGIIEQLFPNDEWARVISHPLRSDETHSSTQSLPIRMSNVNFPPNASSKNMVVAVGPEGGWDEPDELDMFEQRGFQKVTLGTRVLRSDVAVISLLALAREVCDVAE